MKQQNENDYMMYQFPPIMAPDYIPDSFCCLKGNQVKTLVNFTHCTSYIWLENGGGFWTFPTSFSAETLSGYGWDDESWIKVNIPLKEITGYY